MQVYDSSDKNKRKSNNYIRKKNDDFRLDDLD